MRKWICSHLCNTTQVSEYKLRRTLHQALLTPPGLDVAYFHVKCSLLPFSALWSSPAISLSIISFPPLFFAQGVEGLWSDLRHIKSGLTVDKSSSDFLVIILRAAEEKSIAGPEEQPGLIAGNQREPEGSCNNVPCVCLSCCPEL